MRRSRKVLTNGTTLTLGVGIGSGIGSPNGVAVDGAGDVYIIDVLYHSVYELSPPTVAASPLPLTGSTATAVSATLTGLAPGTTYYARAVASNAAGSVADMQSPPRSFTTLATLATTTTINAPDVTYNANGVVTVTESSTGGTPTGTVTLSVNGGTAQSQILSGGIATFTLISPAAGSYVLSVSYAGQGNFLGSSASGSLLVNKATSTTTVTNAGGTYSGAAFPATSVVATGAGGLDDTTFSDFTFSYVGTGATNFGPSANDGSFSVITGNRHLYRRQNARASPAAPAATSPS